MKTAHPQEARRRIGAELRFLREGKELMQIEVAEKIGVTQNTISKVENGEHNIGIDTIIKYAEVFEKKVIIS